MAKIKITDLAQFGDLFVALDTALVSIEAAKQFGRQVRTEADEKINAAHAAQAAHELRTEFRPRVVVKEQPNSRWTIALNDQIYTVAPFDNFADLGDHEPRFWWSGPDEVIHSASSMFKALLGVLTDFGRTPDAP